MISTQTPKCIHLLLHHIVSFDYLESTNAEFKLRAPMHRECIHLNHICVYIGWSSD